MTVEKLLDLVIKAYIEEDIMNLDVSDSTQNSLKRALRKKFKNDDFINDLKNSIKED